MSIFKKNLGEDEELAKIVRYHPLVLFPSLSLSLALLCAGAALSFYLGDSTGNPALSAAVFAVPFLAAFMIGMRKIMAWRLSGFMLTDRRIAIFKQKGFFGRQVSEIGLDKIEDVSYRTKGFLQALFRYGTVTVQAAGDSKIRMKNIPHPQRVQESVMFFQSRLDGRLRKEAAVEAAVKEQDRGPITAEEALERLPAGELSRLTEIVDKIKAGKE